MAKSTLPTNYKDDILNAAMNGKRRYNQIPNDDGTFSLDDTTVYDQVGNDFGAGQVNEMNRNINESADAGKIIDDPDVARVTSQTGYIAGVQLFKQVDDSLAGGNVKFRVQDGKLQYSIFTP